MLFGGGNYQKVKCGISLGLNDGELKLLDELLSVLWLCLGAI